MSSNPFLSKEVKLKRAWKALVIALPVVIMMFALGNHYVSLIDDTLRNNHAGESEDKVLGAVEEETATIIGVDGIKQRLTALIQKGYILTESKENFPGIYDGKCISLYSVNPKDYSELEKKYLDSAYIQYCPDINTATLTSQLGEVRYNKGEGAWFYYYDDKDTSGTIQEKKVYGDNTVTISEVWGSHHSWDAYIVSLDNSKEVIIIMIPQATRIRCEEYDENGVETWTEECVGFLKSMNMPESGNAWVYNDLYDDDYKDLLEMLREI